MPFAIENDKNKNKFKTGSTLLSGSAYKEITAEWSSRIGLTELSHASSDASLARNKKKDRIWTRLDHFACCMVLVLMRGCKATQGLQIVHPKSLTRSNVGKPFKTKESAGVIYENSSLRSCLVGCAHKEEITTGMDA